MNQYDEAEKVPHFHFVASQPDPTPQDVAAPTPEQLAAFCEEAMHKAMADYCTQEGLTFSGKPSFIKQMNAFAEGWTQACIWITKDD